MNLLPVANYLQARGLGTVGRNIFVTEMPASCKTGIMLMHRYAGRIDHELPGWRDTGFRIIVRHEKYTAGDALAASASSVLTIRQDTQMGNFLVRKMLPQTDPQPYRRSEAGVWEFEVEIETVYILD